MLITLWKKYTEVTHSVMAELDSEASRTDLRVCVGGDMLIPTGSYKQPNEHSIVLYLVFDSHREREVVLTMRKVMQQCWRFLLGINFPQFQVNRWWISWALVEEDRMAFAERLIRTYGPT